MDRAVVQGVKLMARPIPKKLLIHSATQKHGVPTEDDTGARSWPSSRALTHVRFEPTTKLVMSKDNKEVQLAAIMFFDRQNSAPTTAAFAVGDGITQTDGAQYQIQVIDILNDEKGMHHLEIGLI